MGGGTSCRVRCSKTILPPTPVETAQPDWQRAQPTTQKHQRHPPWLTSLLRIWISRGSSEPSLCNWRRRTRGPRYKIQAYGKDHLEVEWLVPCEGLHPYHAYTHWAKRFFTSLAGVLQQTQTFMHQRWGTLVQSLGVSASSAANHQPPAACVLTHTVTQQTCSRPGVRRIHIGERYVIWGGGGLLVFLNTRIYSHTVSSKP